jgi:transposase
MHDQDEEVTNQTSSPTSNKTEAHPTEASGKARSAETARVLLRRAKRATRRRFSAEDKVRILLEGIRGELAVAELCRREGIHPAAYYKWLKDFMEAGKSRMRGDSLREATSDEVQQLRQENERLKQLVADLSLNNMILKKSLS